MPDTVGESVIEKKARDESELKLVGFHNFSCVLKVAQASCLCFDLSNSDKLSKVLSDEKDRETRNKLRYYQQRIADKFGSSGFNVLTTDE